MRATARAISRSPDEVLHVLLEFKQQLCLGLPALQFQNVIHISTTYVVIGQGVDVSEVPAEGPEPKGRGPLAAGLLVYSINTLLLYVLQGSL